jgi:hypothetical protein
MFPQGQGSSSTAKPFLYSKPERKIAKKRPKVKGLTTILRKKGPRGGKKKRAIKPSYKKNKYKAGMAGMAEMAGMAGIAGIAGMARNDTKRTPIKPILKKWTPSVIPKLTPHKIHRLLTVQDNCKKHF